MSFPVSAAIAAELDRVNATVEESFQAGDMARLVQAAYTKDVKALPPGPHRQHSAIDRRPLRASERRRADCLARPLLSCAVVV